MQDRTNAEHAAKVAVEVSTRQIEKVYLAAGDYHSEVVVLARDGSIWRLHADSERWIRLPDIPNDR